MLSVCTTLCRIRSLFAFSFRGTCSDTPRIATDWPPIQIDGTSRAKSKTSIFICRSEVLAVLVPRFALQFSDHELVRRAATEALCNLLPHPKMIDHLKVVDNLKLWAAFSQLGVEDPPTAAAALGCLAMAVRDPEVRNVLQQRNTMPPLLCWYATHGRGPCAAVFGG